MSIFKITFKKEIPENRKNDILDILIANLSGSLYTNIERIDNNKIVIEGEFFSFNPFKNVPWNLWTSFSRRTEVKIIKNEISYTLDFTYAVIASFLSIVFLLVLNLFFFKFDLSLSYKVYGLIIFIFISILSIGYGILRHRKLFLDSLKNGSRFKGTYNWESILKTKTIAELEHIANGITTLTEEVQELAKEELIKRK
ncbi:MAG: hypothetical protein HY951_13170 [Bacteroidia bacterium]|nr:hypothetical protein [Bacteroidia bacterium]